VCAMCSQLVTGGVIQCDMSCKIRPAHVCLYAVSSERNQGGRRASSFVHLSTFVILIMCCIAQWLRRSITRIPPPLFLQCLPISYSVSSVAKAANDSATYSNTMPATFMSQ
jgi:hypothetical protein